jgi:heterodisulfide reductase subunit A-like polyferredoxin
VGNFTSTINSNGSTIKLMHGAIIVATGAQEYKPRGEYLYGEDDRVLTQIELEQKIASGAFNLPHTKAHSNASTVVMIQCVGSRTPDRPYCSKICCTHAIKNALKLKSHYSRINVYILYRDLRTHGFREDLYTQAAREGVIFIRYEDLDEGAEDGAPQLMRRKNALEVTVKDAVLNETIKINPDLVVLSPAIVPPLGADELAKMLKVPLNRDGFMLEAHMKLQPLEFAAEGIYLCGLAHSPQYIDECIVQARGAGAKAAGLLAKGNIETDPITAEVDELLCRGCGRCVQVCDFDAVAIAETPSGVSVASVNPAICKGCGSCAVACPTGAITARHFTDLQVTKMIEAALKKVETVA